MAKGKLVALLARHGEVQDNQKSIFRGWRNESLEPEGLTEARESAKASKKYPVKRIISSPMTRALETAKCYAEVHGLEVEQEAALMPFHVGIFTGLDKDENLDAYQLFADNPEVKIPNGESQDDIHDRVGKYFKTALPKSESRLTLFVAHSSTAVVLSNIIKGSMELIPGLDEVVAPAGLVGIYEDGDGYTFEVLVDEEAPASQAS